MTPLTNYKRRFVLACLLLSGIACTKKNSDYDVSAPQIFQITSLTNKAWNLGKYNIITDKQNYFFTGNDIAGHALNRLEFSYLGNYSASSASWSGVYSFSKDSTKISLSPDNPALFTLLLNIDHLSPQVMVLSSAVVICNQQIPGTSEFERFVETYSKMWLYNRGIDVSDLKSVKIKFVYSSR